MKLGLVFSGVFLGLVAVVACGGDDGGGSGSGGSSSGGASGGGAGASGAAGSSSGGASSGGASSGGASSGGAAGTSSGGASSGGAAGAGSDLAECKAKAATNPDPACANCACDGCLAELKACEADATCVGLRNCAQKNNCCDEICVLLKCGPELQAAGGVGGPGTTKASAVKDCTVKNTCNCCK